MLVNAPFTKWHHKFEVLTKHTEKLPHKAAVQDAELFIRSVENPKITIPVMTGSLREANIKENRNILKSVAEAVLYCGRQCIALRGDNENPNKGKATKKESEAPSTESGNETHFTPKMQPSGNPGNFLTLIKLVANHDTQLKMHMETPKLQNATCLSHQTQNEMIDVIGKRIIQAKLVQEVKDAQIYTIMVDEVTSHNVELMPLCIRFVDKNHDIREELLEICVLPRITGQHTAARIKGVLTHLGIQLSDCRGQGYDGASNMSSENVGVQALIKKDAPKAVFTHCSGHCLNLVIGHSCSIPVVRKHA